MRNRLEEYNSELTSTELAAIEEYKEVNHLTDENESDSKSKAGKVATTLKMLNDLRDSENRIDVIKSKIMNNPKIPLGVPIQIGYGFTIILKIIDEACYVPYTSDITNEELIQSLHWLMDDGICIKVEIKWTTISVMYGYLTVNKNAFLYIYQLPENLAVVEPIGKVTKSVTEVCQGLNLSKYLLKLFLKHFKKDTTFLDNMCCFYSDINQTVANLKGAKELSSTSDLKVANAFQSKSGNETETETKQKPLVTDCPDDLFAADKTEADIDELFT